MKIPVKLQELLTQNSEAIASIKALITQEMVIIDATGIDSLADRQLEQILGNIPKAWDFDKLRTIFNADTVSKSLEQQLTEWCNCRQGKQPQQKFIPRIKLKRTRL